MKNFSTSIQRRKRGKRTEYFASDQPPLPPSQDLLRKVNIDTWTGLVAGNACQDYAKEEFVMNVTDRWAQNWLRSGEGRNWLEANDMPRDPFFVPDRECSGSDPHPVLQFSNLGDGSVISQSPFPIQGVINVNNGGFRSWRLEYGAGPDPQEWTLLVEGANPHPNPELIHTWDLSTVTGLTDPNITLRLYLVGDQGFAERRVNVTLSLPTPTPTVTPTATQFPPTETPTTIPPTAAPVTPTESVTPFPTVPTDTPVVVTPTPTP